jgi:hypothetical protein
MWLNLKRGGKRRAERRAEGGGRRGRTLWNGNHVPRAALWGAECFV